MDPVGGRAKRGVGDGGGGFSKKDGCYFSLASNNDAADKLIAQVRVWMGGRLSIYVLLFFRGSIVQYIRTVAA